jgi:nucleoside triphosphate diphosphatase
LFAAASYARKLGVDPEAALSDANAKFERRFRHIEQRLAEDGVDPEAAGAERLEDYWNEIREADKSNK